MSPPKPYGGSNAQLTGLAQAWCKMVTYILNTNGIMECHDLKTGKIQFSERVRGSGSKQESWSSMIIAGDRIYIPNQSGETIILQATPKFKLIGINELDGALTNSSLAASDGQLFLRTHKHLWCIGKRQ